jgi:hypothetical protein
VLRLSLPNRDNYNIWNEAPVKRVRVAAGARKPAWVRLVIFVAGGAGGAKRIGSERFWGADLLKEHTLYDFFGAA